MTNKWEMCIVNFRASSPPSINFFGPGAEPKSIRVGKYAKSLGIKGGIEYIYSSLLADGWEPFATFGYYANSVFFRRKVNPS